MAVGAGSGLGGLVAAVGVEVEGSQELVAAEDDDVVAVAEGGDWVPGPGVADVDVESADNDDPGRGDGAAVPAQRCG